MTPVSTARLARGQTSRAPRLFMLASTVLLGLTRPSVRRRARWRAWAAILVCGLPSPAPHRTIRAWNAMQVRGLPLKGPLFAQIAFPGRGRPAPGPFHRIRALVATQARGLRCQALQPRTSARAACPVHGHLQLAPTAPHHAANARLAQPHPRAGLRLPVPARYAHLTLLPTRPGRRGAPRVPLEQALRWRELRQWASAWRLQLRMQQRLAVEWLVDSSSLCCW